MAKSTRPLSGAAKDAYLRRTIRAEEDIPEPARDRLIGRMREEIASLALRQAALPAPDDAEAVAEAEVAATAPAQAQPEAAAIGDPFDPFSPNVIVVIRTRGRDAVLAQLCDIRDVDNLRRLAREQQLGIEPGLASAEAIREAIVAAAERRIANRRAAAS